MRYNDIDLDSENGQLRRPLAWSLGLHLAFDDQLKTNANILIFPDLNSGNICYKLLHHLGGAEAIGPILMGMNKPVHVLQRGDSVDDIVNMAAIAVVDVQNI